MIILKLNLWGDKKNSKWRWYNNRGETTNRLMQKKTKKFEKQKRE